MWDGIIKKIITRASISIIIFILQKRENWRNSINNGGRIDD
ncbi:MAG: hypothetical protein ACP5GR_06085 [Thermoplasmata archaeon]